MATRLHAAGELVRQAGFKAAQADELDVLGDDPCAFRFGDAFTSRPNGDVALDGEPGEQRVILKHHRA